MLRKPLSLLVAVGHSCFALAACGDDSGSATATTSGSSGSEAPAASSGAPDTGLGFGRHHGRAQLLGLG